MATGEMKINAGIISNTINSISMNTHAFPDSVDYSISLSANRTSSAVEFN